MSSQQPVLLTVDRRRSSRWHAHLRGLELAWAIAFVTPYAAVFLTFVAYPIGFALWMAARPALYAQLFADPIYRGAVVNTLLFVTLGVNLKMFGALLLSGFFLRRDWWVRAILVAYLLPWLVAATQAFISIHWMLIDEQGLLDRLLAVVFGITGPSWLGDRWPALGTDIVAYIWKWMPFWTLIFVAARMAIPQDIYDAADVDGASGYRRLIYVTFPLLGNVYLISTLLATVWTLGDFNTVFFVTSGAPGRLTDVLATYGFNEAFTFGYPNLGVAAMMTALPLMIPLVILLMRRVRAMGVQL